MTVKGSGWVAECAKVFALKLAMMFEKGISSEFFTWWHPNWEFRNSAATRLYMNGCVRTCTSQCSRYNFFVTATTELNSLFQVPKRRAGLDWAFERVWCIIFRTDTLLLLTCTQKTQSTGRLASDLAQTQKHFEFSNSDQSLHFTCDLTTHRIEESWYCWFGLKFLFMHTRERSNYVHHLE